MVATGPASPTAFVSAPTSLARFSYAVLPADRDEAIDSVPRGVGAARSLSLDARLLSPVTRAQDGAALQFELASLDQLRRSGAGAAQETSDWMRAFSDILLFPPAVETLRVDEQQAS